MWNQGDIDYMKHGYTDTETHHCPFPPPPHIHPTHTSPQRPSANFQTYPCIRGLAQREAETLHALSDGVRAAAARMVRA
eukprot:35014-Eustigmatos_ZCMA.PRE.1